jgi:hypothetical protein
VRDEPTSAFQSVMGELNATRGILIIQVMQDTDCCHNIGVLKSRVAAKGVCVAHYESPLAAVHALGSGNVIGIDVESEIVDIRKPLQRLCWTTSDVDYLVSCLGPNVVLHNPPTQRIPPHGTLKRVV